MVVLGFAIGEKGRSSYGGNNLLGSLASMMWSSLRSGRALLLWCIGPGQSSRIGVMCGTLMTVLLMLCQLHS
uniref:Uncharacterized protein n=1 Tax=Manihot esculenta TaxID=3983 RepID=A0A2C9VSZ2_MANES